MNKRPQSNPPHTYLAHYATYTDCKRARDNGRFESGIYEVQPDDLEPFNVSRLLANITYYIIYI